MKRMAVLACGIAVVAMISAPPASAESVDSSRRFGGARIDAVAGTAVLRQNLGAAELPGDGFRVRDVRVQLNNVTHSNPSDIDALLETANGFATSLMSDAGGEAANTDTPIVDADFVFDDDANADPNDGGPLTGGTYDPSDFDAGENDGASDGFAEVNVGPDLDLLDALDPEELRGDWSIAFRDDSNNARSGDVEGATVLIRLDRPNVDTLTVASGSAKATATAFGPNCTISAANGYEFDLNVDGDFADTNEGPGTNTRPLSPATSGLLRVRVTQGGGGCATTGAFRIKTLKVTPCGGRTATRVGTNASETIVGTSGNDIIAGLGGNDTISGGGGADIICAGSGADTINGGAGADKLYGDLGADKFYGGGGNDRLLAKDGVKDLVINGGTGTDTAGRDTIDPKPTSVP